jgi:BCD family chlorophyll transporter-like MFS transporter
MLLVGTLVSAILLGQLLQDFSPTRLVGVVQGSAVLTMVLNLIALWKQEPRRPSETIPGTPVPSFSEAWRTFTADRSTRRLLIAVGLGTAAFGMQDVLLEPYGAQVLAMSVGETTRLTALWAAGTLGALALAARRLGHGDDPLRLAAIGILTGVGAFAAVVVSAPTGFIPLLGVGVVAIGFGGGLFGVGTLTSAMALGNREGEGAGLALGAYGAVQATSAGIGLIVSGLVRDLLSAAVSSGSFGPLVDKSLPYSVVWHIEIGLLFATLVALGPLVRRSPHGSNGAARPFGLQEFPA